MSITAESSAGAFADDYVPHVVSGLTTNRYGSEAVVYASEAAQPLYLDTVGTLLLDLFDGDATVRDLVEDVVAVIGIPNTVAKSQIVRVLASLSAVGALVGSPLNPSLTEFPYFSGPINT